MHPTSNITNRLGPVPPEAFLQIGSCETEQRKPNAICAKARMTLG